jgi:hypothetical protein
MLTITASVILWWWWCAACGHVWGTPNRVAHECVKDLRRSRNVVIVLVLKVRYIIRALHQS